MSDDNDIQYLRMHADEEHCEQRDDGLYVRCPYCNTWNETHDLMVQGCQCGANAGTYMMFTRGEDSDD